jgi:hypothetical protein
MDPRIEYVDIDEAKVARRNPKLHDRDRIVASLQVHGFVAPAAEDGRTGRFVAGHGRLEALRWMRAQGLPAPRRILVKGKRWLMPVLKGVAFKDEREAEEYLLADNRASEVGGWEPVPLAEILANMGDPDLDKLGWARGDIAKMMAQAAGRSDSGGGGAAGFSAGAIRQMVFAYPGPEFDRLMRRLGPLMTRLKVADHTELFLALLDFYEKNRG